jgi:integrase
VRPRGNIEQRSPGSYRLRYSLGRDPVTGRRRTTTTTTTVRGGRKDAERELTRLLRSIDTEEHVDPTRITVRHWLETWLDTVRAEISPKAHERYEEIVRVYLLPTLGNIRLQKLTASKIQEAYNTVRRRDGEALAPSTRRYIHVILKSALARAVEQTVIARNPADAIRAPRIERKEMTTLTVEQSAQLLASIRHKQLYWPVLLALTTGMRRGEILALRWKNVDLERKTLGVTESLEQTASSIRFKRPKSDRTRAITLPAFAVEELRRLKREQAEGYSGSEFGNREKRWCAAERMGNPGSHGA